MCVSVRSTGDDRRRVSASLRPATVNNQCSLLFQHQPPFFFLEINKLSLLLFTSPCALHRSPGRAGPNSTPPFSLFPRSFLSVLSAASPPPPIFTIAAHTRVTCPTRTPLRRLSPFNTIPAPPKPRFPRSSPHLPPLHSECRRTVSALSHGPAAKNEKDNTLARLALLVQASSLQPFRSTQYPLNYAATTHLFVSSSRVLASS